MEKQDIQEIMATLKAAYPNSFQGQTSDEWKDMLRLWFSVFQKEQATDVRKAVMHLIETRRASYTPTIGEVKEELDKIRVDRFVYGAEEMEMLRKLEEKFKPIEEAEKAS